MKRPRIAVFDLGKVLLSFDYSITASKIVAQSSISEKEFLDFILNTSVLEQYETGLLSTTEFFETFKQLSGFAGPLKEFASLFTSIFTPVPEMVRLNETLRGRGISTYVFSNTNEMTIHSIRKQFPFYREFDGHFLSFEHHVMKPHERFYQIVEAQTGCQAEDIVYVDDLAENVAAGRRRGWHAIQHVSPASSVAQFTTLFSLETTPERAGGLRPH